MKTMRRRIQRILKVVPFLLVVLLWGTLCVTTNPTFSELLANFVSGQVASIACGITMALIFLPWIVITFVWAVTGKFPGIDIDLNLFETVITRSAAWRLAIRLTKRRRKMTRRHE